MTCPRCHRDLGSVGEWREIDSAPKDGTWIVAIGWLKPLPGEEYRAEVKPRAGIVRWLDEGRFGVGWEWRSPGFLAWLDAAWWMPLPPSHPTHPSDRMEEPES